MPNHPDYPNGFPPAADKSLFGIHEGVNIVPHEHGYELVFSTGHRVTVGGDRPDTVKQYIQLVKGK